MDLATEDAILPAPTPQGEEGHSAAHELLALPRDVLNLLLSFLSNHDLIGPLHLVSKAMQRAAASAVNRLELKPSIYRPSLQKLTKKFPNVKAVDIIHPGLRCIGNLRLLSLWSKISYLHLQNRPLQDIRAISADTCPALRALRIDGTSIQHFPENLPPLLEAFSFRTSFLHSIHPLAALHCLKELEIGWISLTRLSLQVLRELVSLETLYLFVYHDENNVVAGLPRLRKTRVSGESISPAALFSGNWPSLEMLDVRQQVSLSCIPLALLGQLKGLSLRHCSRLHSLMEFDQCVDIPSLQYLDMSDTYVTDLNPLARCRNLRILRCGASSTSNLVGYYDLTPLAGLPQLAKVIILYSPFVKVLSLRPLWLCPALQRVMLSYHTQLSDPNEILPSKVIVSNSKCYSKDVVMMSMESIDWKKYLGCSSLA